jgi:predicted DNA-binding transcriptional regulator YafY
LDRTRALPPVNVTQAEAMAIAVALGRLDDPPFADAARSALRKLVAVMPPADAERADELARRVDPLRRPGTPPPPQVPDVVIEALATGKVLLIEYEDKRGVATTRPVEPMGYVGGVNFWYLLAWCRLRDALRAFRLDRIVGATATDEVVTPRPVNPSDIDIPELAVTQVTLTPPENTDRTVSRGHLSLVPSPATGDGAAGGDPTCPR